MEKMRMESKDITAQNIEKIGVLFPDCITESPDGNGGIKKAVNFELLKRMLSDETAEADEAYEFTWVGKKSAAAEVRRITRKTLRPCPEESRDWDTTENLYLEGENLEILKLLQESYLGRVKMIYIDPPYNTGHDFIYPDSFLMDSREYNDGTGYFDEEGNVNYRRRNGKLAGRYHSDWCSMIYARLLLARNLLREDGILFLSINDTELFNLQKICCEVFGDDNFLACFPRVTKRAGKTTEAIARNHDYVLAFGKSPETGFYLPSHTDGGYRFSDEYEARRGKYKLNQTLDYDSLQYSPSLDYPIELDGETFYPGSSREKYLERKAGRHARADWAWRWSRELFEFGYKNGFIVVRKKGKRSRIYTKTYQKAGIVRTDAGFAIEYTERTKAISTLEFVDNSYSNDNAKKNLLKFFDTGVFDYSKPVSLPKALAEYTTRGNDIIMDFFSGSATTAQAVLQLNAEDGGRRRFIMVQLPEACGEETEAWKAGFRTICDIGKERIRRAGEKIKAGVWAGSAPDVGFRVFKLDESNMKDIYYSAEAYSQSMILQLESNIRPGRTDLDLLFGCLLEWGLPLTGAYRSEKMGSCTIHTYNDGDLIACFDEAVPESILREIASRKPRRAVFRDSGFEGSTAKINADEIFKVLAPDTRIKVL